MDEKKPVSDHLIKRQAFNLAFNSAFNSAFNLAFNSAFNSVTKLTLVKVA